MGENQRGFKSLVYRVNIQKMKELPQANCGRVTDRGEEGYGAAKRGAHRESEAKKQSPKG